MAIIAPIRAVSRVRSNSADRAESLREAARFAEVSRLADDARIALRRIASHTSDESDEQAVRDVLNLLTRVSLNSLRDPTMDVVSRLKGQGSYDLVAEVASSQRSGGTLQYADLVRAVLAGDDHAAVNDVDDFLDRLATLALEVANQVLRA